MRENNILAEREREREREREEGVATLCGRFVFLCFSLMIYKSILFFFEEVEFII